MLPKTELSNKFHTLQDAVLTFSALGFSVFPVDTHKKPTLPAWKCLQTRQPKPDELTAWFENKDTPAGLAIVCGIRANLAVLDFDDFAAITEFRGKHAELFETFAVITRRGLHLYYHLPPKHRTRTRHCLGVDLLYEGSYVVAPPSHTGYRGHIYQIANAAPIKTLTSEQLTELEDFLDKRQHQLPHHERTAIRAKPITLNHNDLINLYENLVKNQGSRNTALYLTSLRAKSGGWREDEVAERLLIKHIQQQPAHPHRRETARQREHEGRCTIASAFQHAGDYVPSAHLLPNNLREIMLRTPHKPAKKPTSTRGQLPRRDNKKHHSNLGQSAALARVLDGLLLLGWQSGQQFTEKDAITTCKGLKIGQDSVRKALKAAVGGKELFKPDVSGGAVPQKNQRGRPLVVYTFPAIRDLCRLFKVDTGLSDPLQPEDLATPQAYRCAVHAALLRRRPGIYPREWLAARLGVSRWTIRRYNRALGVQVTPVYGFAPLSEGDIDRLEYEEAQQQADEATYGVPQTNQWQRRWLQTAAGWRYRLQAQLARQLLAQGASLFLVRQEPNHYCFPDDPAAPEVAALWRCYHCCTFAPHYTQPACHCAHHPPPLFVNVDTRGKKVRTSSIYYDCEPLTWQNVNKVLPPKHLQKYCEGLPFWLETTERKPGLDGRLYRKRYPVIIGLAYRLIKKFGEGNVVRVLQIDAETAREIRADERSLRRSRLRESYAEWRQQQLRAAAEQATPPDLSGLWACPNCGQTYYNFGGNLPDTCAFCGDFTTWQRMG